MKKKKIIACQIFIDELHAVLPEAYSDIDIAWLDAGLHMNLDKLETTLKQVLKDAAKEGLSTRVLYGSGCHPDMCHIIDNHDGKVLGAKNCVHAFCGESLDALEQIGDHYEITRKTQCHEKGFDSEEAARSCCNTVAGDRRSGAIRNR